MPSLKIRLIIQDGKSCNQFQEENKNALKNSVNGLVLREIIIDI